MTSQEIRNIIDNLKGLIQCLKAGEDWCSVAKLEGAVKCLEDFYKIEKNYEDEGEKDRGIM